jgi:hypothetical protein
MGGPQNLSGRSGVGKNHLPLLATELWLTSPKAVAVTTELSGLLGYKGMEWIHLAEDMVQWQVLVHTAAQQTLMLRKR